MTKFMCETDNKKMLFDMMMMVSIPDCFEADLERALTKWTFRFHDVGFYTIHIKFGQNKEYTIERIDAGEWCYSKDAMIQMS